MTISVQSLRSALLHMSDTELAEVISSIEEARDTSMVAMLGAPAREQAALGAVADNLNAALCTVVTHAAEDHFAPFSEALRAQASAIGWPISDVPVVAVDRADWADMPVYPV